MPFLPQPTASKRWRIYDKLKRDKYLAINSLKFHHWYFPHRDSNRGLWQSGRQLYHSAIPTAVGCTEQEMTLQILSWESDTPSLDTAATVAVINQNVLVEIWCWHSPVTKPDIFVYLQWICRDVLIIGEWRRVLWNTKPTDLNFCVAETTVRYACISKPVQHK